ncbi:MAG: hypothetical protein AAGB12_13800 [Pseudomonadota bacterium]
MNRPRSKRNKNLPVGLYHDAKGFVFLRVDKKRIRLGHNKAKAIAAANHYNSKYRVDPDLDKLLEHNAKHFETFGDYINHYESEILPNKKLSDSYRTDVRQRLVHLKKAFSQFICDDIGISEVTVGLNSISKTDRQFNAFRSLLSDIFNHAVDDGVVSENFAAKKKKKKIEKKRIRLTIEGYQAIYAQAPPWLQNAMDLALQTTHSINEVVNMKFEDADESHLKIIRKKVEGTGAAYVKIPIGLELQSTIKRCRDDLVSPYLVHRKPLKKVKGYMNVRDHPT